jgi:hypothetical protein
MEKGHEIWYLEYKEPVYIYVCIYIKMDLQEAGWRGDGLDRAGSGYGQVAGNCKRGNELSGSMKWGEFLD